LGNLRKLGIGTVRRVCQQYINIYILSAARQPELYIHYIFFSSLLHTVDISLEREVPHRE
jgi:hypothetical protein